MKYPEYRQQGLPTTSALMESLVKEINIRVKGTEKFWNDGASGEAILQIRAAALGDDDRLTEFLSNRPGHPYHPQRQSQQATASSRSLKRVRSCTPEQPLLPDRLHPSELGDLS